MSTEEDKLSPEERLLKVIQSGGAQAHQDDDSTDAAAGEDQSAVPGIWDVDAEESAEASEDEMVFADGAEPDAPEKSGLKLASRQTGAETSDGEVFADAGEPAVFADAGEGAVFEDFAPAAAAQDQESLPEGEMSDDRQGPGPFGIAVVNRCVATLLIGAVIALLGIELLHAMRPDKTVLSPSTRGQTSPGATMIGDRGELVDAGQFITDLAAKPFMLVAKPDEPAAPAPADPGIREYLRRHMVVLGFSWDKDGGKDAPEAILMDRSKGNMQIVKPGDEIQINDQAVKIIRIENETVVGNHGGSEIVIGRKST